MAVVCGVLLARPRPAAKSAVAALLAVLQCLFLLALLLQLRSSSVRIGQHGRVL